MSRKNVSPREQLVWHVQTLERLTRTKHDAAQNLADALKDAQREGFDPTTLKVVLKLRKMTPSQRRQRRALEAIYMGALGLLDGDPLPDEARRRLDGQPDPEQKTAPQGKAPKGTDTTAPPARETQPPLALKDPAEARTEGSDAAAAGKRIYDNPYPAGDPCRAAWDEGWCAQSKSHGMDPPTAYQRRTDKPADDKPTRPGKKKDGKGGDGDGDTDTDGESDAGDGSGAGAGDGEQRGTA